MIEFIGRTAPSTRMHVAQVATTLSLFCLGPTASWPSRCLHAPVAALSSSVVQGTSGAGASFISKEAGLHELKQKGAAAIEAREAKASMLKVARLKVQGIAAIEAREARASTLEALRLQLGFAAAIEAQQVVPTSRGKAASADVDLLASFRGEVHRQEAKRRALADARAQHARLAEAAKLAWEAADHAMLALRDAEQRLERLEAGEGVEEDWKEGQERHHDLIGITLTFEGHSIRIFLPADATTNELAHEARRLHESLAGTPLELSLRGKPLKPGVPLSAALHANARANHVVVTHLVGSEVPTKEQRHDLEAPAIGLPPSEASGMESSQHAPPQTVADTDVAGSWSSRSWYS